jgi:hypothetical protein
MRGWRDRIVLAAILASVTAVVGHQALSLYNFFDMSSFMDAGWRVARGQRPYVDFQYLAGPVHLYLHALTYLVFGFSKTAILAHVSIANAIVMIGVFLVARRRLELPLLESALVTLLAGASFYGTVAHPFYDHSSALFLILACFLCESCPPATSRSAGLLGACCGVLAATSVMAKTNVGLGGTVTLAAVMAVGRHPRAALAGYAAGVLAGLAAFTLTLASPADFLHDTTSAFMPTHRLANWRHLRSVVVRQVPYGYLLGVLGLVAILSGRRYLVEERARFVLVAGLLATAILMAWTSSFKPAANLPLLGVATLGVAGLARRAPESARIGPGVSCAGLGVLLAIAGTQMARHGPWVWHPAGIRSDHRLATPGFEGWRCNRDVGEGVDRVVEFIRRHVPAQDSLFVFPDCTVIYGMAGRESYRKAPFLFHYGILPSPGRRMREFQQHFRAHPPRWFVRHRQRQVYFYDDVTLLKWLELDDLVERRYRETYRWGDFQVLRLVGETVDPERRG